MTMHYLKNNIRSDRLPARDAILRALCGMAVGACLIAAPAFGSSPESKNPDLFPLDSDKSVQADPVLNASALIDDRYVRLGDLFANVGDLAEKTVAHAPLPGERATLDAKWLFRVARAYRLNWRPVSLRQQVIVERAAQVISAEEIRDVLHTALMDEGATEDMELELLVPSQDMHVPTDVMAIAGVERLAYDKRSGRFSAVVAAPAGDPAAKRIRVAGMMHPMVDVPVVVRTVRRGETIRARDLEMQKIRAHGLRGAIVRDLEQLIGMTPKRILAPDRPIRTNDVQRPQWVERGKLVTLELRFGAMALTAQGKALDNGSEGDLVRVRNQESNQIVEAEVVGDGRVQVELAIPNHDKHAQLSGRR